MGNSKNQSDHNVMNY